MSVKLEPHVRSWFCPSSFEDQRRYNPEKVKKDETPTSKAVEGAVIYRSRTVTKTFGRFSNRTDKELRKLFAQLAGGYLVLGVPHMGLHMLARTVSLFSGDFYRAGCKFAQQEFLRRKSEDPTLGKWTYRAILAKQTLWQLVKNIAQIVTYPFASIALFFISVYGAATNQVQDARLAFSAVEEFWSPDVIETVGTGAVKVYIFYILNYLAPCQLPKEIWDKKNIYRLMVDYNSGTIRSLFNSIILQLEENKQFYNQQKIPVDKFLKELEVYKCDIKSVSEKARGETDKDGNLNHNRLEKLVAGKLLAINTHLKQIKTNVLKEIEGQQTTQFDGITPQNSIIVADEKERKAKEDLNPEFTSLRMELLKAWKQIPKPGVLKEMFKHFTARKEEIEKSIDYLDEKIEDLLQFLLEKHYQGIKLEKIDEINDILKTYSSFAGLTNSKFDEKNADDYLTQINNLLGRIRRSYLPLRH